MAKIAKKNSTLKVEVKKRNVAKKSTGKLTKKTEKKGKKEEEKPSTSKNEVEDLKDSYFVRKLNAIKMAAETESDGKEKPLQSISDIKYIHHLKRVEVLGETGEGFASAFARRSLTANVRKRVLAQYFKKNENQKFPPPVVELAKRFGLQPVCMTVAEFDEFIEAERKNEQSIRENLLARVAAFKESEKNKPTSKEAAAAVKGKPLTKDLCECGPQGNCGEECLNRLARRLCSKCAPGPSRCLNRIPAMSDRPLTEVEFINSTKGCGLIAKEDIEELGFIGVYSGEITKTGERIESDYVFFLIKGFEIDAEKHGSRTRYINTSHTPNAAAAIMQKPNGEWIVFIYALRKIRKFEEIYINYQWRKGQKRGFSCICDTCTAEEREEIERGFAEKKVRDEQAAAVKAKKDEMARMNKEEKEEKERKKMEEVENKKKEEEEKKEMEKKEEERNQKEEEDERMDVSETIEKEDEEMKCVDGLEESPKKDEERIEFPSSSPDSINTTSPTISSTANSPYCQLPDL